MSEKDLPPSDASERRRKAGRRRPIIKHPRPGRQQAPRHKARAARLRNMHRPAHRTFPPTSLIR